MNKLSDSGKRINPIKVSQEVTSINPRFGTLRRAQG